MAGGESERPSSTDEAGEPSRGTLWREGGRRVTELLEGKTMGTLGPSAVSTRLQRIAEQAREAPTMVWTTLHHHIDLDLLREAYERTRKDGAPGVDGQEASCYAEGLEDRLLSLLERFKSGSYHAPPVRRVLIPKEGGKTRPIGIPTFEDKVLQRAVAMILEAVYEQDFKDCSFGFRPGRSAHQALGELRTRLMDMHGGWVVEADIQSFFDTLDHGHLRSFLELRVRDGVIRRMIDKWLAAGVLEGGTLYHPEAGTPQGGVISPLLANIYLHGVLDRWFEEQIRPRLDGSAFLIRYADDFVFGFSSERDARRVYGVLPRRLERFGLRIHPEKTRLIEFRRPAFRPRPKRRGRTTGARTFDLLGFTHHWGRSRRGNWVVKQRTAGKRFRRAIMRIDEWCRKYRHAPVKWQHGQLARKLRGHYAYYGITGNARQLCTFKRRVERTWKRWLNRRSQRRRLTWARYQRILNRYPLPPAVVVHSIFRRAANP
jgi:RNA-directed DNA polymerase